MQKPTLKLEIKPYLSVVHGRKPEQKLHKTLPHAKNAFDTPKPNPLTIHPQRGKYLRNTHGWGSLWELKDGEWELLYEIPQPTDADYDQSLSHGYGDWETRPWRLEK